MRMVRQILQTKGNDLWSVDPDTLVFDALKLMAEKNVGALLVLSSKRLVGIFSERDYARRMILKGKLSKETLVSEVMTENPICVSADQTLEECMRLMTENHIRHLPVLDRDGLLGVISIGDVVKEIILEQRGTISHLENYITGGRK
jgi:CBS domain-containing protein